MRVVHPAAVVAKSSGNSTFYTAYGRYKKTFGKKFGGRKKGTTIGTNATRGTLRGPFGAFDRMTPFPPHYNAKLTYTEDITISSSNLSNVLGVTYYMGLNTLFDPYLAAGGHQPYGFDQLCSSNGPYYRYKVNGCLLKVTYSKPSATDLKVCGAIHGPTGYANSNTISGLTEANIKEKQNTWIGNLSTSGRRTVSFKQFVPMNIMFEWDKGAYRSDMSSTTGNYAGNPGSIVAFETGCLDTSAGTTSTCLTTITLVYYCTFYDRAQLGSS